VGVWDQSRSGLYYDMATLNNPSPPASLGCGGPVIAGLQTLEASYMSGSWNGQRYNAAWSAAQNSAWSWAIAGPSCSYNDFSGQGLKFYGFLNSITIRSFSTGQPYVQSLTYTCGNIFTDVSNGISVRAGTTTTVTSKMLTVRTGSGHVGQPTYYMNGAFLINGVSGTVFNQGDIDAGRVAFVAGTMGGGLSYIVSDNGPNNGPWQNKVWSTTVQRYPVASTSPLSPTSLSTMSVTATKLAASGTDGIWGAALSPSALTWKCTMAPPSSLAGTLFANGVAVVEGSTFTQQDVLDGKITFVPRLAPGSFYANFLLLDGFPDNGTAAALAIEFHPPPFASTGQTVGTDWVLGAAPRFFDLSDLYNPVPTSPLDQVLFQVLALQAFKVETLSGSGWAPATASFSAYQIYQKQVRYSLQSSGPSDLTYTVQVGQTTADGTFSVYAKYPPVVTAAPLTYVGQTGSPLPLNTILSASDPDTTADQLVFTVTGSSLRGANLWKVNSTAPVTPPLTFTQTELTQGIYEIRPGVPSAPLSGQLQIQLTDGSYVISKNMTITLVVPAVITSRAVTVAIGKSTQITPAILAASSTVSQSQLSVNVVQPFAAGKWTSSADPLSTIATFSFADVAAGNVWFAPDAQGPGPQTSVLNVTDGSNAPLTYRFNLTVNSLPTITVNNQLGAVRNTSVIVSSSIFSAADVNGGQTLQYAITTRQTLGCFRVLPSVSCLSSPTPTWTQAALQANQLSFLAVLTAGTEVLNVTVSDGLDSIQAQLSVNVTAAPILVQTSAIRICGSKNSIERAVDTVRSQYLSARAVDTAATGLTYTLLSADSAIVSLERYDGTSWNSLSVGSVWLQSDVDAGYLKATRVNSGVVTTVLFTVSSDLASKNGTLTIEGGSFPTISSNQPVILTQWYSIGYIDSYSYPSESWLQVVSVNNPAASIKYTVVEQPSLGILSSTAFTWGIWKALSSVKYEYAFNISLRYQLQIHGLIFIIRIQKLLTRDQS
ncbi:hypothetical protein HDU86_000599, partial [Geranomyces michiganensis]